jgi:hypothetical protein
MWSKRSFDHHRRYSRFLPDGFQALVLVESPSLISAGFGRARHVCSSGRGGLDLAAKDFLR